MKYEEICHKYCDLMGEALNQIDFGKKEVYANYLAQTYHYVKHSTPLLALSAGLFEYSDRKYFRRFLTHISEENNHELLALKDLKRLGFEISDFPELPETKMLWEPQYYKVQNLDPLSLMGYIIPLELFAAKHLDGFLERVSKAHGEQTASFIRVHSDEDVDHVEKAMAILNEVDGKRKEHIVENIAQSSISYVRFLEALDQPAVNMALLRHIKAGMDTRSLNS